MDNIIIENSELNQLIGSKFELIVHDHEDGQFNMDFDYHRTELLKDGMALPLLRLYGWHPWTVSLGYNQKEEDISKELLASYGFGLVRRPTGGRAVLHADELTYSVVMNIAGDNNQHDIYRRIHDFLLKAFQRMGAKDLQFEKSNPDLREFYSRNTMSVACFASAAKHEIELKGRKVVGSAQRIFGTTLLQHGSILLDSGHEMLSEVVNTSNNAIRVKLKDYMLSHSATLSEACGRKVTYEETKNAIISSI